MKIATFPISVGFESHPRVFESLVAQLKAEQDSKLEHLRAQLRLANKLFEFTVWHSRVRTELATRIAVAEAAENIIKKSFGTAAELVGPS